MWKVSGYINRKLSLRISLTVVLTVAVLLTAALAVMFHFARRTIKEETLCIAEQTLEGAVQQIDNILLSVEQASGNVYCDLLPHLDQPARMTDYCIQLVKTNPYITGCAIAFEPYYYKERGEHFITYVHELKGDPQASSPPERPQGGEHSSGMVTISDTYGNTPYTKQNWYSETLKEGKPRWTSPIMDLENEGEAITSFCLPIYDHTMQRVGVLGVDMRLSLLSQIIHNAKPTPNSYCALLDSEGFFIVHPDSSRFANMTSLPQIIEETDSTSREAARAIIEGQTGYKYFQQDGAGYYVFYKPFQRAAVPGRSTEDLKWSIGLVYPKDDIFGDYNRLLYDVVAITILGLLLLLVLCHWFTHRQLLPLRLLTKSAQHIADGHYDIDIPDSQQQDEIGSLQEHFKSMQQALASHVGQLEELRNTLQQRGEHLGKAYEEAKAADRMKTAFLHNMTNQMIAPARSIVTSVDSLCDTSKRQSRQQTEQLVDNIQQQGKTIAEVLNKLLVMGEEGNN